MKFCVSSLVCVTSQNGSADLWRASGRGLFWRSFLVPAVCLLENTFYIQDTVVC